MAPNSKRTESRRMTRGAAKLARIQLPEYKNSDWKNYIWCLLCEDNKRPGFYTTRALKEHYAKRHKRHFGRGPVPTSMGELRTNAWTWCLLCTGAKRPGFYTTGALKEHYAERHKRHFGRDPVPKSKGELRTNEFCVTCGFYVSDMIEHQTTVHVPKNFRRYACADCDDRFVLCHQLERHVALLECRKRMGALVKAEKREHAR